jgi:hypothetical protein
MIQKKYLFMPKICLRPGSVTSYNEVLIRNLERGTLESITRTRTPIIDFDTFEEVKFKRKFHNFKISDQARKNIANKVNWLFLMSKPRYVLTASKKEIFNFKVNFMTLTLPSKQVHNTEFITKNCFNQFLTEIRQQFNMENYVWRLEFQGNGNLHYHIVTDTYCDYFTARTIWNRILNKYGYVSAYTEKFSKMSLSEYAMNTAKHEKLDWNKIAERYAKGNREKWKHPNSIDVEVCTNDKSISKYLSKYFGKGKDANPVCNELDNEANSFGIRLWFCSRSLSKLDGIKEYTEVCEINFYDVLQGCANVIEKHYDYCKALYFNFKKLSSHMNEVITAALKNYAFGLGYSPYGT